MAIQFPKILTATYLSSLVWVQREYTYGINDTGPWQRYKASGRNADVEGLANELANAGWTVTVTRNVVVDGSGSGDTGFNPETADYGISTVEAQAGWQFPQIYGTETPEDIWEFDPQDIQQDLTKADMPFATVAPLVAPVPFSVITTANAVKQMIDSNYTFIWADPGTPDVNGDPTPFGSVGSAQQNPTTGATLQIYAFDDAPNPIQDGSLIDPTEIHLPPADYVTAKNLYYALKAGQTEFPQEASIIRHSMVTSNQYAQEASYANVDRIISSSSMYNIEDVPTDIFFSVPSTPIPTAFLVTPGDLQYGWRKIRPNVTRLNRWKWRIQQNYLFGLYPTQFFGLAL
jgi:hypothetical protein